MDTSEITAAADRPSADADRPQVPALPEPARAQLIALTAEIVGRLPADEVPTSLRAIARFAPAKRQRLGATALAAALDADEAFRQAVARIVVQTSPQLAAALRDGAPTTAADPLDIAVIAYLTRPPGWLEMLAAATKRWTQERDSRTSGKAEVDALRAELAALRARAKGEAARLREAASSARRAADAELAELVKTLRQRSHELRQAERERDTARAAEAELRARVESHTADHELTLRRLRAQLSDAERAGEVARRVARTERDVDDARLWLLVDTLVQAANGVRRELSLAAPTARPADAVASAGAAAAANRAVRDPLGLDRLLALPNAHLVVDGYNVTKTGYGELSLIEQRSRLIGALAPLAAQSGAEITIAFDGGAKPPAQPPTPRGVRVLFSAADEIADDLIRRLVAAEPGGRPVIVVTNDQQVVTDTGRDGAWSVPSQVLLARLG